MVNKRKGEMPMSAAIDRVIPVWNEVEGCYEVSRATLKGMADIKGASREEFNASVAGKFPKGSIVEVEYEDGAVVLGPQSALNA